jgi:DNA-binding NtrC family response regulator
MLCRHFLDKLGKQKGLGEKRLHPEVADRLLRYDWPGNVRELENMLERLVILCEGDMVLPQDLPARLAGIPPSPNLAQPTASPDQACPPSQLACDLPADGLDFNAEVEEFERRLILQALERTGWVKNQAASLLKLNRTTLVEKIKKKGIAAPGAHGLF